MATANLSVGINTTQAKTDLQALKSFMQTQLSDMALSINEKSLEASITRAMKGPSGNRGYRLVVDTAALKSDIQTAINDAARGAKAGAGSGGSIDATKLTSEFSKVQQQVSTLNAEIGKLSAVTPVAQATTATKQLGNAHKEATTHTKTHAAAMRDAHSAARGLASGFGLIWLTWGNVAPLLAGASLSHGFMQAMKAGSEFAYQLTFVKALGGETEESVRGIGNAALELSKNGLYGPTELANGLRVLNQAGIATKDSMMALPQVFDLATVGEMSMGDAAITLAGVMTAFNLQVKDMSHIGDVFSKAAAESQTSVEQMTQAMKTASVVGYQYGAAMEDTATALTLLAKMNITGTAAGTSLRNMLKELYSPTDKAAAVMKTLGVSAQTAQGELRSFPDIIFSMKSSLEQYNKAGQIKILQAMFGERGAKEAIAMLSQTRGEWDKLNKTISESAGFMAKVSSELEATTKGSFKKAINTLQATLIEAFNDSEGAAGQLAARLQQVFNSESFKVAVNGITTGMLALTNALVAIGPVLAAAAAGWVALRAVMVAEAAWALAATAITNVTMTLKAFTLVATGAATTVSGATGLAAALRMVLGPFGLVLTAVTAVTTALGYLYNRMNDYGPAQVAAQNANTAASAMENLAKKTAAAAAEFRRLRLEKEGKTEVGDARTGLQQREATYKEQKTLLDALNKAQVTDGISISRGFMISALTNSLNNQKVDLERERKAFAESQASYNAGLSDKTQGAYLDADSSLRDLSSTKLKPSQVKAKELARSNAEWLKANTDFIIQNYGDQAGYVLDRITKNLNEQVQDAKVAVGTKNFEDVGSGRGSAKELGRYETNRLKNVLKEQTDIEKLYDAHYKRLVAVENASAQAGLITREEAENKVTQLTEEQTRVRLQINEGFHNHLKGMLATSNNMTASQKEQIEGEMERRGLLILELQEELSLKRELAKIASAGAEKKFQDSIDKNNVDLTRELELAKAAAYGKAKNPIDRARDNGETLVSNRYAQLMQEAVDARIRAEQSGDEASIKATAARLERLDLEVQQAKKYYGDQYAALAEYQQTGQYGWDKFWEKYQENGTTAAKVVEQSMESVTKNLEDAFSKAFETGKFDAQSMFKAILGDVGKLTAKLAVADLGKLLFGKGKNSGSVLGDIFGGGTGTVGPGGMISEEGAYKKPEDLAGMLTQAAEGLKKFWGSLTGTTEATENAAVKTAESVVKTVTKTTAESAATSSLLELATAARMAAASMSGSSGSGGGSIGSLLGGLFGGGSSGAMSTAAKYGTLAGSQQTAMLAAQDLAFLANGGAFAKGIQAFAKGGTFTNSIVSQPTLFKFANGTGLMGEAGPEAIMPLARDSQGRLGVRYEGREAPQRRSDTKVTNNNISVSVNAPGGDPAQVRRSGAAVAREVSNAVAGSGRYR